MDVTIKNKTKYLLTIITENEVTERFEGENNCVYFPSVWIVKEESHWTKYKFKPLYNL